MEELRQPALALLRAYFVNETPHASLLHRLKALGCFRNSSVAQQYCDATHEIAKDDEDIHTAICRVCS